MTEWLIVFRVAASITVWASTAIGALKVFRARCRGRCRIDALVALAPPDGRC